MLGSTAFPEEKRTSADSVRFIDEPNKILVQWYFVQVKKRLVLRSVNDVETKYFFYRVSICYFLPN